MNNSKTKFTPGPWTVETQFKLLTNVTTGKETRIQYYEVGSDLRVLAKLDSGLNDHSNAALISAAPELYAILEKINTAFYTRTTRKAWLELMEQTKPLLQKARGES